MSFHHEKQKDKYIKALLFLQKRKGNAVYQVSAVLEIEHTLHLHFTTTLQETYTYVYFTVKETSFRGCNLSGIIQLTLPILGLELRPHREVKAQFV